MGSILKLLGGPIGPYIAGALGAAFLGLSGAVWLLSAELKTARADLGPWKAAFATEQASFRQEQSIARQLIAARKADHHDAVTDANNTQATCDARVVKARKTASAISTALSEPPHEKVDPAEPELILDSVWSTSGG